MGHPSRWTPFAQGLDRPRRLAVLPNGHVPVTETDARVRPRDNQRIKGCFFKMFRRKAGRGVPGANRITLLRDADGDAERLNAPFGGSTL